MSEAQTTFFPSSTIVRSARNSSNASCLPSSPVEIEAAKRRYANAILREPNDPFKAGIAAVGESLAGYIYNIWQQDIDVLKYKEEILEELGGEEGLLDSKVAFCKRLMQLAGSLELSDPKEALKAYDLVATIRGFKSKPVEANQQQTNIVNKVMVIGNISSEDEWEKQAIKQQKQLIDIAAG